MQATFSNFDDAAQVINTAHAKHAVVKVNGQNVYRYGSPATVFGTGTLGINVQAKSNPTRMNQIWFKPGTTLTVEVTTS
jgi:hypothetical protein